MNEQYLIIKAKGGMGNRMLCAASGLFYAKITGRRAFVDWTDQAYANTGINAFPFFFSTPICPLPEKLSLATSVFPKIWSGFLDRTVNELMNVHDPDKHSSIVIHRKYSIDPAQLDYKQKILVYWSYIDRTVRMRNIFTKHHPIYAGKSKTFILRDQILTLLPLQHHVVELIKKRKAELWQEQEVIGVHIRHTDRQVDTKLYINPLRRMLNKMHKAAIFIATDDFRILKYFKSHFDNVVSTPKWYPEGSGTMHYNSSCPDPFQNGLDALVDMYLLAECDALIFPSNSTFSWISSMLSNAPPENIIDVLRFDMLTHFKRFLRDYVR